MARAQLPHMDWEEVEPHLMLGWATRTHASSLQWDDVRAYAHESWNRSKQDTH